MLPGLRHDRLVCGDDEADGIHASRSRKHIAYKTFVAGDVHKSELRVAQPHVGESQIDGNSAFLLLLQAVRVSAGERTDQRRFSVVDVSGSSNDEKFHHRNQKLAPQCGILWRLAPRFNRALSEACLLE